MDRTHLGREEGPDIRHLQVLLRFWGFWRTRREPRVISLIHLGKSPKEVLGEGRAI